MSSTAVPTLLMAENLAKVFDGRVALFGKQRFVQALSNVSFQLGAGEILGVVGESGCGKSTLAKILVGLERPTGGRLEFGGRVLLDVEQGIFVPPAERRIQMVFQDPYGSLDPRMTVERLVGEGLEIAGKLNRSERRERVLEMLSLVGLSRNAAGGYPHQFSGGQRQRIGIARSLVVEPRLMIADEAVSALDVSVQMQILNLFLDIRARLGLSIVFISHNIQVVQYLCDRIVVMRDGAILEAGRTDEIISRPQHRYTASLIEAAPDMPTQARATM
jgi:ABC-type glutathione transport system ATPase component